MLRLRSLVLSIVVASLFVLCIPTERCPAITRTWDNDSGDNEWYTSTNWGPNGGPDVFDDLSILSGSSQTISSVITDSGGLIAVDGSSTSAYFGNLYIANSGTAGLYVQNGGMVSNAYGYVGSYSGSAGAVTVNGAGSTWNNDEFLYIGRYGTGTLNIENGGSVISNKCGFIGLYSGSSGIVTVTGVGSTWTNRWDMSIGDRGTGTLIIENGGNVSNDWSCIGYYSGSTGAVTVTGTGSTWINDDVSVGENGTGTLNIEDGGTVLCDEAAIGDGTGSGTVTVTGAGSTWDIDDEICVGDGDEGTGTLSITNSGSVSCDGAYIGCENGSVGVVTVTATGSTWTNEWEMFVGDEGTGTLNITNGGSVSCDSEWGSSNIGSGTGSVGIVTVTGTGSTWTNGSYLNIGRWEGMGTLNITNGGAVSSSGSNIGGESGATGVVTVDGTGSTWTNDGEFRVGMGGTGTLNIENGGSVSCGYSDGESSIIGDGAGSVGIVTVTGTGSTWTNSGRFHIGLWEGTGTLNIEDGGSVSCGSEWDSSCIGNGTGSVGVVTVTGTGSTWTNSGYLNIGGWDGGTGTLNIENGGSVSCYEASIGNGYGSVGVVTVTGTGSTWINSDYLGIGGYEGTGTLNIEDGGSVSCDGACIGDDGSGVVTVTDTGSTWTNSSNLHVGYYYGQGTMNIINGGVVSNSSGYIGYETDSTGEVTVDGSGSTWTNNDSLYVSGNEYYSGGPGELTISNGGSVEVGYTLKVWNPGTVNLTGGTLTVNGIEHTYDGAFNFTGGRLSVGTFSGDLVNNGGTLAPGTSPGITNIQGDYTQAVGAAMEIEIGGLSAGTDYDRVILTGTADLAGTLDLSLIGEYVPDFYDEFVILTAGTLNGMFDTITGFSVSPDMSLAVVYNADNVTIVAAIPGDATLNGYVDGGDLDILLADWGTGVPPANHRADLSGDSFVDGDDLDIILSDWGKGVPPPVPEPASATLLLLGAAAMLKRRSQRTV